VDPLAKGLAGADDPSLCPNGIDGFFSGVVHGRHGTETSAKCQVCRLLLTKVQSPASFLLNKHDANDQVDPA
jgi:hypothetical protein